MPAAILIELNEPLPEHEFRDFGEDVRRALGDTCAVSLAEIDAAASHFTVREIRRAEIGTVTGAIQRVIRRYGWQNVVRLSRNDRDPPAPQE